MRIKEANTIAAIGIVLNAIAIFFLSPTIKLHLGVKGLGLWHLINQINNYLQLSDMGVSNGVVREIAASKSDCETDKLSDIVRTGNILLTFVGIFFLIFGICTIIIVPLFIQIPPSDLTTFIYSLLVFSFWGLIRYRASSPLLQLLGTSQLLRYNCLNVLQNAGRPFLAIFFVIMGFGIVGVVTAYVLSEAITRIIGKIIIGKRRERGNYIRQSASRMMRFGGATIVISISSMILFYSSSMVVGWKMGIKEVAIYQSTIALPIFISRFALIPFTNLRPILISSYEKGNYNSYHKTGLREHWYVIILTLVGLLVVSLINHIFVSFWVGPELYAGKHFTYVYCFFLLLSSAKHNGYVMLQANNRLRKMVVWQLIEIPVAFVMSIILIQFYGLVGIAYGYLFASFPVVFIAQIPFYHALKHKYLIRQ